MVQEIITYPTPTGAEYSTEVRAFNEELFMLIDDLKDTITANDLNALAAFQIGSHFNVVIIKEEDGSFLELINPKLLSTNGKMMSTETTAYFPGLSAEVMRHENISVIYQDRDAKQLSLKASGERSALIQRKLDYTFGSTFLDKLSKEEKAKFEKKLEFGSDIRMGESCPTTFKRDYFSKSANILFVFMVLVLVGSFFVSDETILSLLWKSEIYLALAALVVNAVYFFYAHYEAKQYTSCISCQSGNIIGTTLISLLKVSVVLVASYFII